MRPAEKCNHEAAGVGFVRDASALFVTHAVNLPATERPRASQIDGTRCVWDNGRMSDARAPDVTEILGPLVSIMSEGIEPFAIERDLVTAGVVRAWLTAAGLPVPDTLPTSATVPATGIGAELAAAFAASRGMRLSTEQEWAVAAVGAGAGSGFSAYGVRGLCAVWEWTSTPQRTGFVVCGGVPRNQPTMPGRVEHRSWEDDAADDVGFRCAISGEPTRTT